jgi:hypothetical protein
MPRQNKCDAPHRTARRLAISRCHRHPLVATRKTRILEVTYNASNNQLVSTNTLVKGAVVSIDATVSFLYRSIAVAFTTTNKKNLLLFSLQFHIIFILYYSFIFMSISLFCLFLFCCFSNYAQKKKNNFFFSFLLYCFLLFIIIINDHYYYYYYVFRYTYIDIWDSRFVNTMAKTTALVWARRRRERRRRSRACEARRASAK